MPGRFADDIPRKLDALREHCRELGRDYASIEKTTTSEFTLGEGRQAGLRQLVDHLRELAALGVDHALLSPQNAWDDETLDAVASIVPEVHAIPTAA